MDAEQIKQAGTAAEHAASNGPWLSEAFAAVGAGIAGFFAARRLRKHAQDFNDEHPLIQAIREEGKANREELHTHRGLLHSIATDIAILKDRRP